MPNGERKVPLLEENVCSFTYTDTNPHYLVGGCLPHPRCIPHSLFHPSYVS